jgi:hypothetical protein
MIRRIDELALGAALLAAVTLAPSARAVPAPDSAQRAALQSRIGHLGRVQIVGERGATLLLKPVVRDDGLHMREPWHPPRQALIEIDATPPPAPPSFVPWSEIAAVQVPTGDFRGGATAGAVVGAFVVAVTLFSFRHDLHADWDTYAPSVWTGAPIVIGVSTLAGGLLFGLGSNDWRTVYPPPRRR